RGGGGRASAGPPTSTGETAGVNEARHGCAGARPSVGGRRGPYRGQLMSVRLLILWVHLVGAVVWIGGLVYQTHVLMPAARRGDPRPFAEAARRARPATWTAVALVVLSGFYNVTQLGSLERVMQTGAGLLLAAKLGLVIVAVALAAQRDFAQVPILDAALRGGGDTAAPLRAVGRLDRVV